MATNPTVQRCFEELGIPSPNRSHFRKKVLNYVRNESDWGNDLSSASAEIITRVTRQCVNEGFVKNWLYSLGSTRLNLSEVDLHGYLLQMVNIWVEEETRQQSQEDQSYSDDVSILYTNSTSTSSTPKKRKRVSSQSRNSNTSGERRTKVAPPNLNASKSATSSFGKHLIVSTEGDNNAGDGHPPRSATIEQNSQPQDVSFGGATSRGTAIDTLTSDENDNYDDLQDLQQIMSDGRAPTEPTNDISSSGPVKDLPAVSKGKAPVRDPPSPQQLNLFGLGGANSRPAINARAALPTDTHEQSTVPAQDLADVSTERSESLPHYIQTRRSFRDMRDLEASEPAENNSPTDSGFLDQGSPSPNQMLQSAESLPTPPQTTRSAQFIDVMSADPSHPRTSGQANDPVEVSFGKDHATTVQAANTLGPQRHEKRDERILDLVYEIKQYVEDCEEHSLRLASDQASSEKERQMHRIRSALLSSLQKDIGTRIHAFFDKEDGRTQKDVSSYCLWS